MTDRTATRHGDRPQIEPVADVTDNGRVQQMRDWIMAHKLDACRVCTGFRIDELGLCELASAPRSRSQALGPSR
jgi:hypothetical protein